MAPPPQIVHTNGGEGETSYAKNFTPQVRASMHSRQKLSHACSRGLAYWWTPPWRTFAGSPRAHRAASCSSGPNTLFLVFAAIDVMRHRCAQLAGLGPGPELRVFLNDLPDNDFNAVFRQLPAFLRRAQGELRSNAGSSLGPVLIFGAPGSFFGRLFPATSLYLVFSSFSLHWLSQVPREVANGELVNKGNIYAGRTSPPAVVDAYAAVQQGFHSVSRVAGRGGRCRRLGAALPQGSVGQGPPQRRLRHVRPSDPANVLNDMAAMGLVELEKLHSYNIPAYEPCVEEMREIVQAEGSFEMVGMESYEAAAAACDLAGFAKVMRAVHEPMLARHFGAGIDMGEFVGTAESYFDRLLREGSYRGAFVHVLSVSSEEEMCMHLLSKVLW